jgi:SAM-dependent methyltransferase
VAANTDPIALAAGPYRTPDLLSARAAVYRWQYPQVDLIATAAGAMADLADRALLVDVGCGPGHYLRRLRASRPGLRLVGVDVSLGMLRAVENARVGLVAGSADALPLRSATADAALAMHVLYHLPEPQVGLTELRRLLRPGGRLVVSTNDDAVDVLWQLFADAGLNRSAVSARWPLNGAREALHAAGFTEVHERIFDYVLDVPTAEPVLAYLDSCRSGLADVTEEAWQDIRRNVAAVVATRIRHQGSLRRSGRVGILTAR